MHRTIWVIRTLLKVTQYKPAMRADMNYPFCAMHVMGKDWKETFYLFGHLTGTELLGDRRSFPA
jgi:hypothetical protein